MINQNSALGSLCQYEDRQLTTLVILIKNPLTVREYDRINVAKLEQKYKVQIFDCTNLVFPVAKRDRGNEEFFPNNLVKIDTLWDLCIQLNKYSPGLVVDYMGNFSIKTAIVFHLIKSKGFLLVVIDSGPVPSPIGIKLTIKNQRGLFKKVVNKILLNIANLVLNPTADIAVVAGTSWESNKRFSLASVKIHGHSFDYEEYLLKRHIPTDRKGRYAVYIDEDIANHRDNFELGLEHPVTGDEFFKSLRRFIDRFEKESGVTVIVAGYPSAKYGKHPEWLKNIEIVTGKTAELISGADFVFLHASTAVSFAVMWRRPTIFLTSNQICKSWYYSRVKFISTLLNAPIINIDLKECEQLNIKQLEKIDQASYESYQNTYIKSTMSPEVSLWSIFLEQELKNHTLKVP